MRRRADERLRRPDAREIAAARVEGFWDVLRLCFARDPDVLPAKYRSQRAS